MISISKETLLGHLNYSIAGNFRGGGAKHSWLTNIYNHFTCTAGKGSHRYFIRGQSFNHKNHVYFTPKKLPAVRCISLVVLACTHKQLVFMHVFCAMPPPFLTLPPAPIAYVK